ncbi:hypothetical protein Tamer19_08670 [Cupriavidus sp. TA19]|nr:hypothetical protein Tamer19_08670 [Cupriavidus sp. TA19]
MSRYFRMVPPWTLPEKLAMSGVISTVMESWWDWSFMMREVWIAGAVARAGWRLRAPAV